MSHELPYIGAIMEGLAEEMARDPKVIYFGQDVAPKTADCKITLMKIKKAICLI